MANCSTPDECLIPLPTGIVPVETLHKARGSPRSDREVVVSKLLSNAVRRLGRCWGWCCASDRCPTEGSQVYQNQGGDVGHPRLPVSSFTALLSIPWPRARFCFSILFCFFSQPIRVSVILTFQRSLQKSASSPRAGKPL